MAQTPAWTGPQRLAFAGLLLTLLLLPFGALYEIGALLCLLAAIGSAWRGLRPWRLTGFRLFLLGLGAYELAALWSLPDAVDPAATARTVLSGLRFLGYGWAAVLLQGRQLDLLGRCGAVIVALWVVDALVQALCGFSLGGHNLTDRVSGIFGDDDLKLGPVLSALCALLLVRIERQRGWWQALAVLLIGTAVLVAGARAGWVSLAVVMLWWLLGRVRAAGLKAWPVLGSIFAGTLALAALLYANDPQFAARMDRTLLLVHGERADVDKALAFRLPIWETAGRMAQAHPLNGVGVRGFRSAYPMYADADDRWVSLHGGATGASHPHQLILELLCETGVPGLLLWLGAVWALLRAWRRAPAVTRAASWGYAAALLAMLFPLNTHLAFYSSFWGTLMFWLLALYCASVGGEAVREERPATAGIQSS